MTKKDYKLIAKAFANCRPEPLSPEYDTWDDVLDVVSAALNEANPKFDIFKFLKAAAAK